MNRLLLAATVGLTVALFAGTAAAQSDADRERARSEFDRGVSLYAADNFQGALEAFQEAFRLRPHPMVRVNMASCYDHLNKPIEAIFHYERFLTESGRTAPAAQRREVEDTLRRLRGTVGEVTFRVAPDGATVVIDDGDSRRTPILEAVRLAAGTHRLETRLAGYRIDRRTVEVPGGGAVQVEVRLEREGSPAVATGQRPPPGVTPPVVAAVGPPPTNSLRPPPVAVGPQPPPLGPQPPPVTGPPPTVAVGPQPPSRYAGPQPPITEPPPADDSGGLVFTTPTIVTAAASGALLITAIITGVMANSANADFEDLKALLSEPSITAADDARIRRSALDKADQANGLALATDVIGAIALVGLGVSAYLFISSQGGGSERASAALEPRLRLAPTFSRDGAGVSLHGAF